MTGGPELRPGAIDGALPGRSAGGRLARSGAQPATPFDALLTGMEPKAGAGPAAGREARPMGRPVGGEIRTVPGRSPAAPLDATEAGTVAGTEVEPVAVALDAAQQAQSLAHGVAERIVASLQGGQAKGTPGGTAVEGDAEGRRDAALTASIAVAASLARRADGAGAAAGRGTSPALAVTHRETVFAAATMASVAARATGGDGAPGAQDPFGGPAAAVAGTSASGPAAETGAIAQGRAEQLMLRDRSAAARGAAPVRVSESGAAAPAAQPAAAASTFPVVPGAVKVLHIQLHPAELGVLEVRMRMTDGGLEVHIESSRPETVALLKSDRDTLERVLRGAGHALDAVTVNLAEKSGGASGQPSQDGWQPPASGARPEAQAGSPREQARDQGGRSDDRSASRPNGPANEKVHDDQDQPAAHVRPRGGLYL